MIKGKRKCGDLNEVLSATSGGYDIFRYYLGKVGRVMQRPWGARETKLSWGIFPHNGLWFYKDQATEESGTSVHFVMKYFSLNLPEALNKISWDFGIGGNVVNISPVRVTWEKPDEQDYMSINFSSKPFEKMHHEFWNKAGVSEEHCNKYNCWAVKDLAINKKRVGIRGELVFAYYCPEEDGVKVYFPNRGRGEKFRNNVSYHHLWNFDNLESCEKLVVQKSNKDMIVTSLITPCVTSTQAEAVKIFDEPTVNKINSITIKPWIFYGSDQDGVKKCKEITGCNKWKYINTPKNLLPDINDAYGYACKFGIEGLASFMKTKGI